MAETIYAKHPDPTKKGTNIDLEKYTRIKAAILQVIDTQGQVHFKDLPHRVEQQLVDPFKGSISWYITTVKLDLEARGILERIPGSRPQQLRRRSY